MVKVLDWPLCQHCRWPRCSMNATTPAKLSCLSNNISQRCGNGALLTSSLPVISFAHVWRRCAVMWHRLCRGYGKHISWLLNAVLIGSAPLSYTSRFAYRSEEHTSALQY